MRKSVYMVALIAFAPLGAQILGPILTGGTQGYYVDSVGGSDANACTLAAPCATIAHLATVDSAHPRLIWNLHKDGIWHETLTSPRTGMTIQAYGTGTNKPLIDGSDPISSAAWVQDGTFTSTYNATVNFEAAASQVFINAFENGNFLVRVASKTLVNATAGTYTVGSDTTSPTTLSIHPGGGGSPITNGKLYEYTARQVQLLAFQGTGANFSVTVDGIWTRRGLHHDGSLKVGGASTVRNVLVTDGNAHSLYIQRNTTVSNSTVQDGYNTVAGSSLVVSNDSVGTNTLTNVIAKYTSISPVKGVGYLSHGAAPGNNLVLNNCTAIGTAIGGTFAQIPSLVVTGGSFESNGSTNPALQVDRTTTVITNATLTASSGAYCVVMQDGGLGLAGSLTLSGGSCTGGPGPFITQSGVFLSMTGYTVSGGSGFTFAGAATSPTVYFHNNTMTGALFHAMSFVSGYSSIDSDFNAYAAGADFQTPTSHTLAAWRTLSGQDIHSTP